jgi:hypothetical protein
MIFSNGCLWYFGAEGLIYFAKYISVSWSLGIKQLQQTNSKSWFMTLIPCVFTGERIIYTKHKTSIPATHIQLTNWSRTDKPF